MNKAEYSQRRMELEESMRQLRNTEHYRRMEVSHEYNEKCAETKKQIAKLNEEIGNAHTLRREAEHEFRVKLSYIRDHFGELRNGVKKELVQLEEEFIKTNETEL